MDSNPAPSKNLFGPLEVPPPPVAGAPNGIPVKVVLGLVVPGSVVVGPTPAAGTTLIGGRVVVVAGAITVVVGAITVVVGAIVDVVVDVVEPVVTGEIVVVVTGARVAGTLVVVLPMAVVVVGAAVVVVGAAVVVVVVGDTAHVGLVIALLSRVTAPFCASSLPFIVALVVAVIDVKARTEPCIDELVPRVAELPTCQNILQGLAKLVSTTWLEPAVVSVDAIWKINTPLGLFCPLSVSVPVRDIAPPGVE